MPKTKGKVKTKPNSEGRTPKKPQAAKPAKVQAVVHFYGQGGARSSVRIVS